MRRKPLCPYPGLLCLALLAPALSLSLKAVAQSAPPKPLSYDCHRAHSPIKVDGTLSDWQWRSAPWTTDFVDIEGPSHPSPRFRTRAKILWDDDYLYIGAELEEPAIKATLTEHDSVIFHDNDFEVFLKPPAMVPSDPANVTSPREKAPGYFEFEINALNTGWDLYLDKPYRLGGKADNSWNIPGLKTAVAIHGKLKQLGAQQSPPADSKPDKGWTVEIAIPWTAYASRLPVASPHAGDTWRINFSRVEWTPGNPKEDNWVWTPQYVVNMHVPEQWGHLQFLDR